MLDEILINFTPEEIRVALLEKTVLQEIQIERREKKGLVGNIYKGKITRLLPGIQSAFVDIGLERAGFLHAADVMGFSSEKQQNVSDFVYVGQELLVQVYKDPLGSKGARLTNKLSLASHYLVLVPGTEHISVSQKITNETEKARLLSLLHPMENMGFIFRTAAEGVSEKQLQQEAYFLRNLWKEVSQKAKVTPAMNRVYEDIPLSFRILRDTQSDTVKRILVDDEKEAASMRYFAEQYIPQLADCIEYYTKARPLFDLYQVEREIESTLTRVVKLPSGGYIVIDQTEAMTTIDVNTGSFVGKNKLEETTTQTNIEAALAIARQVRLRNLGGIIIIDFIDMEHEANKNELLQTFKLALAKDSTRTEISELSSLGLVQMTRKRTRESLEHILCVTCPTCLGRGSIKSFDTVMFAIFRDIERAAQFYPWEGFLILTSHKIISHLRTNGTTRLKEIEKRIQKPIELKSSEDYNEEQYDILPLLMDKK